MKLFFIKINPKILYHNTSDLKDSNVSESLAKDKNVWYNSDDQDFFPLMIKNFFTV